MNPLVMVAIARTLPTMFGIVAASESVKNLSILAGTVVQGNQGLTAAKVLGGALKFVSFIPLRSVGGAFGGAIKGALGPVVKFLPGQKTPLEDGLLFKIVQKKGQTLTVVTGPDFAMVAIYNSAKILVGIIIYMVVKVTVKAAISHMSKYMEYKSQAERNSNGGGDSKLGDSKVYLNT